MTDDVMKQVEAGRRHSLFDQFLAGEPNQVVVDLAEELFG